MALAMLCYMVLLRTRIGVLDNLCYRVLREYGARGHP